MLIPYVILFSCQKVKEQEFADTKTEVASVEGKLHYLFTDSAIVWMYSIIHNMPNVILLFIAHVGPMLNLFITHVALMLILYP